MHRERPLNFKRVKSEMNEKENLFVRIPLTRVMKVIAFILRAWSEV